MKWQANGELAGSDLHALVSHLHDLEREDRARELLWLGRKADQGPAAASVQLPVQLPLPSA